MSRQVLWGRVLTVTIMNAISANDFAVLKHRWPTLFYILESQPQKQLNYKKNWKAQINKFARRRKSRENSVLTRFRVWVSISLGAAVGWCLLIVLLLGEAEGKRLGGASCAARLRVSQPAVAAALLGTVREMECHTALGLEHANKQEKSFVRKSLLRLWKKQIKQVVMNKYVKNKMQVFQRI